LDKQPIYSKFRFITNQNSHYETVIFVVLLFIVINSLGQETTIIKTPTKAEFTNTKVFYSQKAINTKTVEVHPKGIMDFSIDHYFGDIGGDQGGPNMVSSGWMALRMSVLDSS
jgi:hypothetical protein